MKKKMNLWVITCMPKSKKSDAKTRKIFVNGDMEAVKKMIEQIGIGAEYKYSVSCSDYAIER